MARKSVVELDAQADATLPDNITGLITPAAVRNMIKDFLNAFRPQYAAMSLTTPLPQGLTATYAAFPFETVIAVNTEFTAVPATGLVTKIERGSVRVSLNIDFVAPNGTTVSFCIFVDGVASAWVVAATQPGTNDVVSVAMSMLTFSSALTPTIQVRAKISTPGSVTLSNGVLVVEAVPVNSYT